MIVQKRIGGSLSTDNPKLSSGINAGDMRIGGGVNLSSTVAGKTKWGMIGGDIEDQEDLRLALDSKIEEEDLHALTNLELENLLK